MLTAVPSGSGRRYVFKLKDFVEAPNGKLYRVDQIILHTFSSRQNLFLKVTAAVQRPRDIIIDPVLQEPRLYLDRSSFDMCIISISSIQPSRPWLVPVMPDAENQDPDMLLYDKDNAKGDGSLIHIRWNIYYL